MELKWLGAGAALLISGCASVEMAQYTVTSFPEVPLKMSAKNPAKLKFVCNDSGLDSLTAELQAEFAKREDCQVVDEEADYWFVLNGTSQYLKGPAHKRFTVTAQETDAGGEESVSAEDVETASAAKILGVAVYETKTLAPVHYMEVPLYDGVVAASAKTAPDYDTAFTKDIVERVMDVFLQQKKDVETPLPLEADDDLRALFAKGDYKGVLEALKSRRINLRKLCEAVDAVEAGEADDATKEFAKDAEKKFGNYYIYLLVKESLTMDPDMLQSIYDEQLLILEKTTAKGLVESCPVALARLEYKLANIK